MVPPNVGLPGNVSPGQSVDVSVDFRHRPTTASIRATGDLRHRAGEHFGIGAQAQGAFWVKVRVAGSTYSAL